MRSSSGKPSAPGWRRPPAASTRSAAAQHSTSVPATVDEALPLPHPGHHRVAERGVDQQQDGPPIEPTGPAACAGRCTAPSRGRNSCPSTSGSTSHSAQIQDHRARPAAAGPPPQHQRQPQRRGEHADQVRERGVEHRGGHVAPRASAVSATDDDTVEGRAHRKNSPDRQIRRHRRPQQRAQPDQPQQREEHEGGGLHQQVQRPAQGARPERGERQAGAVQEEDQRDARPCSAARGAASRPGRRAAGRSPASSHGRHQAQQEPVRPLASIGLVDADVSGPAPPAARRVRRRRRPRRQLITKTTRQVT